MADEGGEPATPSTVAKTASTTNMTGPLRRIVCVFAHDRPSASLRTHELLREAAGDAATHGPRRKLPLPGDADLADARRRPQRLRPIRDGRPVGRRTAQARDRPPAPPGRPVPPAAEGDPVPAP